MSSVKFSWTTLSVCFPCVCMYVCQSIHLPRSHSFIRIWSGSSISSSLKPSFLPMYQKGTTAVDSIPAQPSPSQHLALFLLLLLVTFSISNIFALPNWNWGGGQGRVACCGRSEQNIMQCGPLIWSTDVVFWDIRSTSETGQFFEESIERPSLRSTSAVLRSSVWHDFLRRNPRLDVRGFHIWRPNRRGEGVKKYPKFADRQCRFCGQRGDGGQKNPKIL